MMRRLTELKILCIQNIIWPLKRPLQRREICISDVIMIVTSQKHIYKIRKCYITKIRCRKATSCSVQRLPTCNADIINFTFNITSVAWCSAFKAQTQTISGSNPGGALKFFYFYKLVSWAVFTIAYNVLEMFFSLAK